MNEIEPRYEVTKKDLAKGTRMKIAAWTAPFALSVIPAFLFIILFLLFGSTPPIAATFFFLGIISAIIGFVIGSVASGIFAYKYHEWLKQIREKMAVDGIRAEEVEWFKNELTAAEKKALKEIETKNLLLADAYRETLASRLTAARIIKSSRKELAYANRRENKLKYLKAENSENFLKEIQNDINKLSGIKSEAEQMKIEAESRLQMIEAAATRGSNLVDSELALKKLSARQAELPLALEAAKMEEEIRRELENETDKMLN
ncbi:MAG: hypothetical protein ACR2F2_00345 [Pyrinomonadaceae bacterium]